MVFWQLIRQLCQVSIEAIMRKFRFQLVTLVTGMNLLLAEVGSGFITVVDSGAISGHTSGPNIDVCVDV